MESRGGGASVFYDATAREYDALMDKAASHAWTRAAFQEWVGAWAPPPGRLLDFGAGTGTDAIAYDERGYEVSTYDSSPGMTSVLRRKLEERPASRVRVLTEDLLSTLRADPVDVITANFAVLNLIEDLPGAFRLFDDVLRPGGRVMVSVLNPLYWKDWTQRWFWRAFATSLGRSSIRVRGKDADTFRYWSKSVARSAAPAFELAGRASVGALITRVRGRHDWAHARSRGERLEKRLWRSFPVDRLGQFFFLAFVKRG